MPTYDTLDLTGMDVEQVDWTGSVLRAKFGHGYGAFALTGNAAGLHKWKISSGGALPDRDGADYGPIGSQTRFDYYYEFFKSHTTGAEEIFIFSWRGKSYHAAFVDPTQSYTQFTADLFDGGVDVEQRRVQGVLYNADGSIDSNPPSVPVLTTLTVLDAYSINIVWTASTDDPGDIYTLAGYEVNIDGTTIIDVGNVLTFTYGFFDPGTGHGFQVRSYDGSPSPNYSAWSNELDGTTSPTPPEELLVDEDTVIGVDDDGVTGVDG